jgi:signal peptidase I
MIAMSSILRWWVAFVAPGAGRRDGSRWQGLWPVAAHIIGLLGLLWAITVLDLFPPVALIVWCAFQALLATHVWSGDSAGKRWLAPVQVVLLLTTALPLVLMYEVVRIPGDSGLPSVNGGEWLLVATTADELPRLGDSVAVHCADGGDTSLARVVGLPGDRLYRQGKALCRNDRCYPTAPMVLEDGEGGETHSATEVVGGRSHLLLPATSAAGIIWSEVLPAETPDDHLALLPDNRASASFVLCNGGEILLPLDRVLGKPQSILYSADWARIGLLLE